MDLSVEDIVKIDGKSNDFSRIILSIDEKNKSARVAIADNQGKWSMNVKVVPLHRLVRASEVPGCIEYHRSHR